MKIITCISNPEQIGYTHGLKASCQYHNLELTTLIKKDYTSNRQRYKLYKEYLETLDEDEIVFFTDG